MRFPTFCHVSEYWPEGYQNLDLMIASSDPLYLWAPSSQGLRLANSDDLPVNRLLGYLESGHLRVIARRDWLYNGPGRKHNPWPAAAWDNVIDRRILQIFEEDACRPLSRRRVVDAPDEDGWQWAAERLERDPDEETAWYERFMSSNAASQIPSGVLQAAEKARRNPRIEDIGRPDSYHVARSILRDARNHVMAIGQAGAEAPFFLHRTDPVFYRTIAQATDRQDTPAWGTPPGKRPFDGQADDLMGQMLEVLGALNALGGPGRLHRFMSGTGHAALIDWISTLCGDLKRTGASRVEGEVLHQLRRELARGRLDKPFHRLLTEPVSAVLKLAEFATAALALYLHFGWLSILHAGVAGATTLWEDGRNKYEGTKWPFLYIYGSGANRDRITRISHALDRFKNKP